MYIIEKERNVYTTVKTTEGSFANSSLKPKYGPGVKRNREGEEEEEERISEGILGGWLRMSGGAGDVVSEQSRSCDTGRLSVDALPQMKSAQTKLRQN